MQNLKTAIKSGLDAMNMAGLRGTPFTPTPDDKVAQYRVYEKVFLDLGITDADAGRVSKAFMIALKNETAWCPPRRVYEHMPEKPKPVAAIEDKRDDEAGLAIIAEIKEQILKPVR